MLSNRLLGDAMHEVTQLSRKCRRTTIRWCRIVSSRVALPRQIQHQERQTASFVGSAPLAADMTSRVSWRSRKGGATFRDGCPANPYVCANGRTGLRAAVVNDVQTRGFTAAMPQSNPS